jgi:molybdate transport system substrate-binding protein
MHSLNVRRLVRLSSFAILFGIGLCKTSFAQTSVVIYAAASTKDALDQIVKQFTAESNIETRISYAGSNALANQIANGAPASIFLSADEPWMDFVEQKSLIARETRTRLLGNDLVLVVPLDSAVTSFTLSRGASLANALGNSRLALANPDAVPAGKYARAALESLDMWKSIEPKLARAENVRAALTFVARGEAPFGIVYRTDALAEPKVRVVATLPPDSHPEIVYPVAIVKSKDTPDARKLLSFLSGDFAKQVWSKFGFRLAARKR